MLSSRASTGYCMALQNGVIAFLIQDPFYPVQISHFNTTKSPPDHRISSTMLDRWCQALLQHLFHCSGSKKRVLLCDFNTSNFDSSARNNFLCPMSVFFCLSFPFYWPGSDIAFSLLLCLEGQHPGVASSLLTLRLVFCGYYLMKPLVEDLWDVFSSNYRLWGACPLAQLCTGASHFSFYSG